MAKAKRGAGVRAASNRGNSGTACNAELLYAGFEGRALEAQDFGGAAVAADAPAPLFENGDDVLALDILEAAQLVLEAPAGVCRRDLPDLEAALGREDDRPLDDVLQLAHVAGPRVGAPPIQHV